MDLSKTIGTVAVVLAVVLVVGYAVAEDAVPPAPAKTGQMKIEEREAQRRVALEEQQKRRDAFERACNNKKAGADFDQCRAAYQRLHITN